MHLLVGCTIASPKPRLLKCYSGGLDPETRDRADIAPFILLRVY